MTEDERLAARRHGRMASLVGRALLAVVLVAAVVFVSATGLELAQKVRKHWHARYDVDRTPRRHGLEHAYELFEDLHLHPQYLFFFPRDPRQRVAMSNATCSLDADGFRGPGPARAGGRQLAFLLGGSAAFGLMASSDATTITGDLNRLQDRYFFVNAGVPSWISTQEMFRLAYQLLDYHPALIVTYDGANDAELLNAAGRLPPDETEASDFTSLVALVGARDGVWPRRAIASLWAYLFPDLKERIDIALGRATPGPPRSIPDRVWQAGVTRYLTNLSRMRALTQAGGARFVAVFQPVAGLHRHLGPGPLERFDAIDRFHRAVVAQRPPDLDFDDLSNVFDQHYAAIPVMNPDVTDETVFIDQVHLYDPGNEIVARHLAELIR